MKKSSSNFAATSSVQNLRQTDGGNSGRKDPASERLQPSKSPRINSDAVDAKQLTQALNKVMLKSPERQGANTANDKTLAAATGPAQPGGIN